MCVACDATCSEADAGHSRTYSAGSYQAGQEMQRLIQAPAAEIT